jgi:hypothetical protein
MQASRFAGTMIDAARAEFALRERWEVERRYRRLLSLSDRVLSGLEQRNLGGQSRLDQSVCRDISRMLVELPAEVRHRFPSAPTSVQEALDGTFEVQEELMLALKRLMSRNAGLAALMDGAADLADGAAAIAG